MSAPDAAAAPGGPLLDVEDLRVVFHPPGRSKAQLVAVAGIDFSIAAGETFGLVGESGSGKSTTARAITRTVPVAGGTMTLDGQDITALRGRSLRRFRRSVQMIFQDPYSSLNPAMLIRDAIGEPLRVHERLSRNQLDARVEELIVQVGLLPEHLNRYPYEFSGGQRQRIAIARAIAVNPRLVIADEALSALDVSTQNQVIRLLEDLRGQYGMSYLFIAHDLAVVRHIADRVGVMYLGRIVEDGPTTRLYERPAHPYTEALLSAVPVPHPVRQRERRRILLQGEVPSPLDPPSGCVFRTRCPYVMDICAEQVPPRAPVEGGGFAACHLHTSGPALAGASVRSLAV